MVFRRDNVRNIQAWSQRVPKQEKGRTQQARVEPDQQYL